jgi:hypothetical protein
MAGRSAERIAFMRTLLLAALALQAAPLDDLWKFKAETGWTYKKIENGEESKIVARSLGEEAGKARIEWKEFKKEGALKKTTVITWSIEEGVLTADAKGKDPDGQEEEIVFGVIKEGAKKDDTWKTPLGEMKHLGTVELIVPAGTYKNAVQTRLSLGEDGRVDFLLVPKVGLVKIALVEGGKETQTWELTEFKPAK